MTPRGAVYTRLGAITLTLSFVGLGGGACGAGSHLLPSAAPGLLICGHRLEVGRLAAVPVALSAIRSGVAIRVGEGHLVPLLVTTSCDTQASVRILDDSVLGATGVVKNRIGGTVALSVEGLRVGRTEIALLEHGRTTKNFVVVVTAR